MTNNYEGYNSSNRGTMQPRQKTDQELFTEAQDDLREANSMISYYTNKKIQAENTMSECVKGMYGQSPKATTAEDEDK